ncbi:MAG: Mpo1-like protein [Polyangiales bacterium]
MADDIKSFEEFWPHYVRAHSSKGNRRLHFVGTSTALGLAAYGVLARKLWPFLVAPVVGYGCAWIGHFFIEGNVPATFGHPAWSLKADFVMWKKILDGTMDAEVEKYAQAEPEAVEPNVHVPDPAVN